MVWDAATVIAIVGILATAVVGLTASWVTARAQSAGHQHSREMADLAELRQIFDEGAAALANALVVFSEHEYREPGLLGRFKDQRAQAFARVQISRTRMAMRLGPDDAAVAAYRDAEDALLDLVRIYAAEPTDRAAAGAGVTRVIDAQRAFNEEAPKRIGSELPD